MNKQIVTLIGHIDFLEAIKGNDKTFYTYLITTDKYNAFEFSCDKDIRGVLEQIKTNIFLVECYLSGKASQKGTRFISLKANKIQWIGGSGTKVGDGKKAN